MSPRKKSAKNVLRELHEKQSSISKALLLFEYKPKKIPEKNEGKIVSGLKSLGKFNKGFFKGI